MVTQNDTRDDVRHFAARAQGRPLIPQVAIAAGVAADTDIAITGIQTGDVIVAVIEVVATTAALNDRTSEASITSDGNIQLDTTATTGNNLLIFWLGRLD